MCPEAPPAPTPHAYTWTTPGTYTVVKSTITLTETTTVASPSPVTLTPGPNTYGGITTTVPSPCPVTVPIGTVSGSGKATTSVVVTSTHTCTEAGVCVIGASSTTVSVSTISVYPVPATYPPGTYTNSETTVTVTETGTVYYCPYASVTPTPSPAPAPSKAAAPPPPAESSPVSPVDQTPPPAYSAPAAPAKPSPPKHDHGAGFIGGNQPGSNGGIVANGNKWAMSYTPYDTTGGCKTADQVSSDIAQIAGKGFTTVRLYATDCSGLQNVGNACKANGLKLLAGVFIDSAGLGAAEEQVSQIIAWGQWDIVEMVVVGNEAIFNEYCSAEALAGFIVSAKASLRAAGYSGPVTTTEPLSSLQASTAALCPVIDVVAANIQPFFNGDVVAASAGTFVAGQLKLVGEACPGKEAYNLECGWPSSGSNNGASVPGASQQHEAIAGVLDSEAASRTVVFSFQNDEWKNPGPFGVEQFFGMAGILAGI